MLLTAFIWGGGFVVTKIALDVGFAPSFVLASRFALGVLFMVLLFSKEIRKCNKDDLVVGVVAGVMLFVAFITQTIGVKYTTPSNNALITSTNVVMVPFLGWLLTKRRPPVKTILLSFTCFVGMAILSYTPGAGLSFNKGDLLTLVCAGCYAIHVSYLGMSAHRINNVFALNTIQLAVAGGISGLYFMFMEYQPVTVAQLQEGGMGLLFLGVFSTGLCFLMQSYGQKVLPPVKVAIFLSLEGMFGSITSILMGYDPLSVHLIVGGSIMIASLILLEMESIPLLNRKKAEDVIDG